MDKKGSVVETGGGVLDMCLYLGCDGVCGVGREEVRGWSLCLEW